MEKNTDKIEISRKGFWIAIVLIVVLLFTVLFLVFNSDRGVKLSTSGVEISPPLSTQKDTIIPSVQPIVKERVVYRSVVNEQPRPKTTSVKNGDTTVFVEGQPANINFGDNSVVGNNNSNISINPKPKLDEPDKRELLVWVNKYLKENGKDKTGCIQVFTPSNNLNPDTKYLIADIEKFLISNGYNVNHAMMIYTMVRNELSGDSAEFI